MTSGVDPRLAIIPRRLAGVGRVIAVTGGKGGIGKSVVASVLALVMGRQGQRAGLLDLDLTSPTDHVILGLKNEFPTEELGLEPPRVGGVRFMSVQYFAGGRAVPLRGHEVTGALIEILSVTHWGELDVLVVDMPPGLGDAALDALHLLPRLDYLVVANGSAVVLETVRRMLLLLTEMRAPIAGVVENMARGRPGAVSDLARSLDIAFAGTLPEDPALEAAFGDPERLVATALGRALGGIARTVLTRGTDA